MTTTHPEDAAHRAADGTAPQPYAPAPWPDGWYVREPPPYAAAPHHPWPHHPHPYDQQAHTPDPAPDGWFHEQPPYAPAPHHPWPTGSEPHTSGAPLAPEPLPETSAAPEPTAPDAEASASPRPAARRASRRRAGSRRRRAPGRRRKPPSKGASRAASAVLITSGLAMVLSVVHQVWWTNVQARAEAHEALSRLEQTWTDEARDPRTADETGAFEPGEGFAILRIPALGLASPIAEGTGTEQVLDRGLVGHYTGTGMPSDPTGNVVLAAHRNTHGEPFREIDRLAPGDRIVVETATAAYTYEVAGRIPETPPTDVSVLRPIPGGSPFTTSGRYITLTTCTPEYSTRGRLIVFGRLVEERPRSRS
ncbi:class E sortase [Streptomyces sp. C10-9-1]|uniref:class E sortase n=1 Tax=Streptomyces sp. C10-9-1 TaxID=1859285 RepID=UPI002111C799|nr:class E sortase [Streptomyces sp. C10-9-1]MCQ6555990.1 class E sortase [Streptomyces sp. C10-9-1]